MIRENERLNGLREAPFKTFYPFYLLRKVLRRTSYERARFQQKPIIELVDRILALKAADSAADTAALESQIDELVFDLYGLTADERAIVNGIGK